MSGRKAVAHAEKAMQIFTKAAQLGYLGKLCERVREAKQGTPHRFTSLRMPTAVDAGRGLHMSPYGSLQ